MIYNGTALLSAAPIKNMLSCKHTAHGVTHGLTEAGYDITLRQDVTFQKIDDQWYSTVMQPDGPDRSEGRFALASTVEEFQMPNYLMGIVHDKSSLARRGLSVLNTCVEPGWKGWLTLELVYHGENDLLLPAGMGIAQVIFHTLCEAAEYKGRYQNQPDEPVPAKEAT